MSPKAKEKATYVEETRERVSEGWCVRSLVHQVLDLQADCETSEQGGRWCLCVCVRVASQLCMCQALQLHQHRSGNTLKDLQALDSHPDSHPDSPQACSMLVAATCLAKAPWSCRCNRGWRHV